MNKNIVSFKNKENIILYRGFDLETIDLFFYISKIAREKKSTQVEIKIEKYLSFFKNIEFEKTLDDTIKKLFEQMMNYRIKLFNNKGYTVFGVFLKMLFDKKTNIVTVFILEEVKDIFFSLSKFFTLEEIKELILMKNDSSRILYTLIKSLKAKSIVEINIDEFYEMFFFFEKNKRKRKEQFPKLIIDLNNDFNLVFKTFKINEIKDDKFVDKIEICFEK